MAKEDERAHKRSDNRLKVNVMMRFGQFRLSRWTNRRQIEWKTSASLWALLVAVNSVLALRKVAINWVPAAIFLICLTGLHYWWVHQNWRRNQRDMQAAFDAFSASYELLELPPIVRKVGPEWMILDAVPTMEVMITAVLSVAVIWFSLP